MKMWRLALDGQERGHLRDMVSGHVWRRDSGTEVTRVEGLWKGWGGDP